MIATRLKNFTPILDSMTQELGLVTSAIYGVVWRHCQLKDGMCYASIETMAKLVGVKRRTIERHLNTLCKAGYLHKIENPGRPNTYQIVGTPVIEQEIKIEGAPESRKGCDIEPHKDTIEDTTEKRESDDSPAPEVQSEDLEDPPDPAPFMRKKRQPSERDVLKSVLTAFFSQTTGVPPPQKKTTKDCKAAAHLWWNPLCEIAAICGDDVERAKKLIEWTVQHMDDKGMTVRTPASIEKIAVGEQARRKRHNGRSGEVREGFTGVTAEQADARWKALKTPKPIDVPPLQPGDGVGARHDMG